jgi:hypothetical protein
VPLPPYISERDGSTLLAVRPTPGASRDEIVGGRGDAPAVKVTAPAIEERASRRLRKLIAKTCGDAGGASSDREGLEWTRHAAAAGSKRQRRDGAAADQAGLASGDRFN